MKRYILVACGMLSLMTFFAGGCAEEVAHTETDKPRLFGGRTHEETTTYRNPDGTYSTEHEKVKTPPPR